MTIKFWLWLIDWNQYLKKISKLSNKVKLVEWFEKFQNKILVLSKCFLKLGPGILRVRNCLSKSDELFRVFQNCKEVF